MIGDDKKYHYLAVANLSALLQNIIKSQRRFLLFKLL